MDSGRPEKMDVAEASAELYMCQYTGADVNKSDNDGNTALHIAARQGQHETVAAYINAGADVNIANNVLQTPLFRASKFGHAECVKLLIQAGAKVNIRDRDGCAPIIKTAERGREHCLKLLLTAGAKVNETNGVDQTVLFRATMKGSAHRIGIVETLLEAGADVNAWCDRGTCLSQCILNNGILLQQRLLAAGATVMGKYGYGFGCLFPAVRKGNIERLNTLISLGASVNVRTYKKGSPLMEAVKCGNRNCVQLLLDRGAMVTVPDGKGFTALTEASGIGDVECLNLLLSTGAYVNQVANDGVSSALMCAARNGHQNCVEILQKAGAHVRYDLVNDCGHTALMFATLRKPPDAAIRDVKILLKLGARVNLLTDQQQNAIEFYLTHSRKSDAHSVLPGRNVVDQELVYLLLGAGEILNLNPTADTVATDIPHFLCGNEFRMLLKQLCREAIRKHLIMLNPHTHLFDRIPKLGLPSLLTKYLLYNSSL